MSRGWFVNNNTRTREMETEESESPDAENSLFYFESDHLALRGNSDYSTLLRTLVILEAQREQVAKQIDELSTQKNYYLHHPDEFLEKIKQGKLETPPAIVEAEIPDIDFKKYNVELPEYLKTQPGSSTNNTAEGKAQGQALNQQIWSYEEQKRLEELLIEYPPEVVEKRRYDKISKALGNRTVQEVASRVKKYFQKLHSTGMPVPGRIPKAKNRHNFLRNKKSLLKPSTSFSAFKVPAASNGQGSSQTCSTSSQGFSVECKLKEEKVRIIEILEAVKKTKEKFSDDVKHEGFTCDMCLESPVIGVRWHCSHSECIEDSVDFCSDCLVEQLMNKDARHPLHHNFVPVGDFYDGSIDGFESEVEDYSGT